MPTVIGLSQMWAAASPQGNAPDDPAARFNAELLACVRAAWGEAFRTLLQAGAANLYDLVPPAAALAASAFDGLEFALAQKVRSSVSSFRNHMPCALRIRMLSVCLLRRRSARTWRQGRCGVCAAAVSSA